MFRSNIWGPLRPHLSPTPSWSLNSESSTFPTCTAPAEPPHFSLASLLPHRPLRAALPHPSQGVWKHMGALGFTLTLLIAFSAWGTSILNQDGPSQLSVILSQMPIAPTKKFWTGVILLELKSNIFLPCSKPSVAPHPTQNKIPISNHELGSPLLCPLFPAPTHPHGRLAGPQVGLHTGCSIAWGTHRALPLQAGSPAITAYSRPQPSSPLE